VNSVETAKKRRTKTSREERARQEASDLAVGARLRSLREKMGLSQRELAKRAGVTNTTISLIEQEAHAPSLASLHRILSAVLISMADFFALPASQQNAIFNSAADMMVVSRGAADLRVLAPERRDKSLQMFLERYEPGAGTGETPISHEGETAVVVIRGTVEVTVGEETHRIKAGGGYQLIGRQPYTLKNVGNVTAVVACACTPPMI
jgi:transcriptional regulator with XRE-family HTH domain